MSSTSSTYYDDEYNRAKKATQIGAGVIVGISLASIIVVGLLIWIIVRRQNRRTKRKAELAKEANLRVQERREREARMGGAQPPAYVYGNGNGNEGTGMGVGTYGYRAGETTGQQQQHEVVEAPSSKV
ncbi:hypothetical protein DM02DRAFT_631001 [Periconia macrospinosa]|uniref:Uncharacterized protein n=1 Tax=Periconia macrospinosa TaxID=97972 RepID=A0A2V1DKA0_9PLEO|nr:hypothetical protein DM02DRAFT_631001 [Periconia macrospinosa]